MNTAIIAIAAAIAIGLPAGLAAIGQGLASKSAMDAIARQPDAANNIRTTLIIALALIEALAIYGLLIAFIIVSKM